MSRGRADNVSWDVLRGRTLGPAPFFVVGILNATPDSFYDGGGVGVLVGWPCFRLRGPYFSIATIGVGEASRLSRMYIGPYFSIACLTSHSVWTSSVATSNGRGACSRMRAASAASSSRPRKSSSAAPARR